MTRNKWILFVALIVLIFGGLVLITNRNNSSVSIEEINPNTVIKKSEPLPDNAFGSESGKVVFIEYGDFQCPACGGLHPYLKPLKEHYKDQLTFIYREFPITSIHPNALAAATAAEAAGFQGKYWEMHDQLYENQQAWSNLGIEERSDQFIAYATNLKLDIETFKQDVQSDKIAQKIQRDQALGKKIGATATPTLVLDGKTLEQDAWDTPENLEKTLRDAIGKSGQKLPKELNKE